MAPRNTSLSWLAVVSLLFLREVTFPRLYSMWVHPVVLSLDGTRGSSQSLLPLRVFP